MNQEFVVRVTLWLRRVCFNSKRLMFCVWICMRSLLQKCGLQYNVSFNVSELCLAGEMHVWCFQ